jgi:hypothetical protein
LQQCGFAATVGADDGDRFSGPHFQVDVAEHLFVRVVMEAEPLEANGPLERRQRDRIGRIDDRRLAVEHFEHAVGGGDGLLDVAEFVGQPAGRVAHAGQHGEENAHHAVGQRHFADLEAQDVGLLSEHRWPPDRGQ